MKEIKLVNLSCKNFMGFLDFNHSFDGKSTDILGDNGTGKTTLKSLFNWILFGKNAENDNDTNFAIRPLKPDGSMLRQVDIEGVMVLKVDDKVIEFKRVQKENWQRKRGCIDQEFTGNVNEYYIDNIPKTKREYDNTVNEICDSEIFKLITDVEYFGNLHWKKQRDIINKLLGVDEESILNSDSKFQPLVEREKKVDDIVLQIKTEQSKINKDLELIPAKIDERNRDINGIDKAENLTYIDKLNGDLLLLNDKIVRLSKTKFKGENQELISEQEKKKSMLEKQKMELEKQELSERNSAEIDFNKKKTDKEREIYSLEYELDNLANSVTRFRKDIEIDEENVKALDAERTGLLTEYKEINGRIYVQGTCPLGKLCTYDDIKESGVTSFNQKKAEDLENNKAKGLALKERKNKVLARIEEAINKLESALKEMDVVGADIKTKEEEKNNLKFEYEPKHQKELKEIELSINECLNKIDELKLNTNDDEIEKQIQDVKERILKANDELYDRKKVEDAYNVVEDYNKQINRLTKQYEKLEELKHLCEEVYVLRNNAIEKRNKEYFKLVRFKMFEEQINGGINETCIATVNGVPYSDLNHAMKINAGLDIINSLQKIYQISAPIWIDNAEAITKFEDINSQCIKLYVAEGYKKLEFHEN